MAERYPFRDIELKWQSRWEAQRPFRAVDGDTTRQKLYVLDMFPYPSGAGLHVGHPEGYTATDIYCRYKRMRGFNVLHPMGWDAFGLPAEQYAIETGTHPRETTRKNINTFRRQIKRLGFSYDWDRELDTTDPAYVKWTQWLFLKLYERGLAYRAGAMVWWCVGCETVLANEEVIDGRCERKGHPVERRPMRQWMLRITAYADRLLDDLERLDWPEHIKEMQRHWIGRSEGADVWFALEKRPNALPDLSAVRHIRQRDGAVELKIFTTRPDTLFGATYMVLSPEHPLVSCITTEDYRGIVEQYRAEATHKSELDRTDLAKAKTGVFTGAYAINPVNQEKIPIWIADYVLASYGTGAIMAVPAHDQRDFEFAKKYGLQVRYVIAPPGISVSRSRTGIHWESHQGAFGEEGVLYDSGEFTHLPSDQAKSEITDWLAAHGVGQAAVNYRLRDWLFSRQRYWGEPIPLVHCKVCGTIPIPASALPLRLPEVVDFRPGRTISRGEAGARVFDSDMEAPLDRVRNPDGTRWKDTVCPNPNCRGRAERETNTMPQWAGSCWYYLRYLDPHNDKAAWDSAKERYWMPVDLYVGGAEHAVLHLLYARFWHKVFFDLQLVSTPEPFQKLVNQGLILGEDGEKMSKSRGNVVNPDEIIAAYGADAFRLYEMFMGPLESVKPWSTRSIEGTARFLNRLWRLIVTDEGRAARLEELPVTGELRRVLHATIKSVSEDLDRLRFNTAISSMMVCLNALEAAQPLPRESVETLVRLASPFAPHVCEELWERLGHQKSVAGEPWPTYDPAALQVEELIYPVQVNGKVRARVTVPSGVTDDQLKAAVLADERIKKFVDGQSIQQVIIVPQRLVNIVI